MNRSIQIKDKTFFPMIGEADIQLAVKKVAEKINKDLADDNPLFIGVLNGAFMFMGDLMKHVTIPCEITFVKLSSFNGIMSTGKVKEVMGLAEDVEGRTVVVVEDIVDTGITIQQILHNLALRKPKQIKVVTFLQKPEALKCDICVDYAAMSIPNDFIIGYGLDYDGYGRNLREIYVIEN
jgi:hypoxanthine phosphoribosyltransferase